MLGESMAVRMHHAAVARLAGGREVAPAGCADLIYLGAGHQPAMPAARARAWGGAVWWPVAQETP